MKKVLFGISAAMVVMLVWGAGVSFARGGNTATYYEDKEGNLCVGVGGLFAAGFPAAENCEWGTKTGTDNTGVGEKVLPRSTGSENVGVGFDALAENEGGSDNTASGWEACLHNTAGSTNTCTGHGAALRTTNGKENTADGASALFANKTGNANVAIGQVSLENLVEGNSNVAIGTKAGSALKTTESNNIDVSNLGVVADKRTTRIGTENEEARAFMAGIWGKATAAPLETVKVDKNGQLVTAASSSARFKQEVHGLGASAARVLRLRPVSYRYKPAYAQGNDQLQYGLIAEQVARLFPALVQYGPGGKPSGVYYEQLPVLLLAQLQQEHARASHQQHEIDQLATEIQSLREQMRTHR
jgi:endosialidase-like protein